MKQNQVKTSQGDEGETAAIGSSGSPRPAPERHSFLVMNSKTDETCIRCKQTRDDGDHYTKEDVEKILERRRAVMPDYDKRLEEWLS